MGLMDKYNKGGVRFNVDIEGFAFCQLKDLYTRLQKDEVVKIDGIYINTKGRFDAHPVAIVSTLSLRWIFRHILLKMLKKCFRMMNV